MPSSHIPKPGEASRPFQPLPRSKAEALPDPHRSHRVVGPYGNDNKKRALYSGAPWRNPIKEINPAYCQMSNRLSAAGQRLDPTSGLEQMDTFSNPGYIRQSSAPHFARTPHYDSATRFHEQTTLPGYHRNVKQREIQQFGQHSESCTQKKGCL